jgi:hypothetical protein
MSMQKSRNGLRSVAAVISALLLSCFTTACQPTPTEEIVVNKGNGALESAVGQQVSEVQEPMTRPKVCR